jgi:hypothetical protein
LSGEAAVGSLQYALKVQGKSQFSISPQFFWEFAQPAITPNPAVFAGTPSGPFSNATNLMTTLTCLAQIGD